MRSRLMHLALAGLLAGLAAVAGCGSDDDRGAAAATPTATDAPTATPTPEPCPIDTPGADPVFGAQQPSAAALATYAKCLPPNGLLRAAGAAPRQYVIPATSLPPVQAQGTPDNLGSPGSCEVWSAGYAMGSYTANLTNQQLLSDLANTVSPGFLYPYVLNEADLACGEGTVPADTLEYLVANTAPSLLDVPYSPSCTCLEQVDIGQAYATDLSLGSWCYLPEDSPATMLEWIKGYLAQGRVVQISIVMPWDFGHYSGGVYDVPTSCPTPAPTPTPPICAPYGSGATCVQSSKFSSGCAQHGVAIVGYDDDMVGPDGQAGALRIMNSFGTAWGEDGFGWVSYGTFEQIYLAGTLAVAPPPSPPTSYLDFYQVEDPRPDPSPRVHLVARVALDAPVTAVDVTMTDPHGTRLTHRHAHAFRAGYLYFTRRDGHQFESGTWTIGIYVHTADGIRLAVSGSIGLGRAAGSTLAVAPVPAALTGTDGQPAAVALPSDGP